MAQDRSEIEVVADEALPTKEVSNSVATNEPEAATPYSIFTPRQRLCINLMVAFAAMFSTLSSYIYYPAIVPISIDLGVSVSLINLTVTSYLIAAAIAPAFMGDMADQAGRRPIYIVMFFLLIGSNIGMALQTSFAALLVLRIVQSSGASGMIGAGYGVIADITTPAERGGFVGILLLLTDIAPSLGPVMGGSIAQYQGWRWIFWFLVILTGSHFLLTLFFLPETQRNIVGNGMGKSTGVYWSLFYLFQDKKIRMSKQKMSKPKRHYPNPFSCLPVLAHWESLMVIVIYAITYSVKMTLQTSLGSQCVQVYKLNYLAAGLVYLPSGVSGGVGSYMTGRFLNRNYRQAVEKLSPNGRDHINPQSDQFPIEKVRLRGLYFLVGTTAIGIVGYGVALMTRTHISVVLLMQFFTGVTTSSTFTMTSTLLTDLNQNRSATAQAASSIIRCVMAGGFIAALEPLVNSIGLGWCFGLYAIVVILNIPLGWFLQSRGVRWRQRRRQSPDVTH